jgi:hypothetical protein
MDQLPFLPPELQADVYLGPATVARSGPELALTLPDGRLIAARMALAFPYQAVEGDEVLAIGKGTGCWVIGVIAGRGASALRFAGDVELSSETGSVRIAAAREVNVEAPEVTLRADKLKSFARDAVERLGSLYQSVSEAIQVHARRSHTVVAESAHTQAGDCAITVERQVRINGKAIHLG